MIYLFGKQQFKQVYRAHTLYKFKTLHKPAYSP